MATRRRGGAGASISGVCSPPRPFYCFAASSSPGTGPAGPESAPGGILGDKLSGSATGVLLALYVFGIGKAALMPVHRWLPAAMVAPTPVSALLHAVAVVKAGVFAVGKIIVYV